MSGGASSWNGQLSSLRSQPEFRWGLDLFNRGFYWEAHESWEELWRLSQHDSAQQQLLQGLILFAAAQLKAALDQPRGSYRLLAKARTRFDRVAAFGHACLAGIRVDQLRSEIQEASTQLGLTSQSWSAQLLLVAESEAL